MAFTDLKITVKHAEGDCSRMCAGRQFFVRNAKLEIPPGESVCIFALGSLLPVISGAIIKAEKGESILDILNEWQCPDPLAKVIFKIEPEIG